MGHSVVCSDCC